MTRTDAKQLFHEFWDEGGMETKELPWPGIEQESKTPIRPENIHEEHTPARSHHFGGWLLGLRTKFAKGIIDELLQGKSGGRSDGTPEVFKMSAGIKQRWCYFKHADRPWLRFFFRNVVCKVRGSLQDDGCRRGCCDGREPETFSMAGFLGVHGLEQRCRFLGQVSPYWAWAHLCVNFTLLGLNSGLHLCSRPEVRMEIVVAGPRPQWKMSGWCLDKQTNTWTNTQTNTNTFEL